MIVITGAAGFIGSALVSFFNEKKIYDAVLVDNFDTPIRYRNLAWKLYATTISRAELKPFLEDNQEKIKAIIQLGSKSGYMHDEWEQQKVEALELHQYLWKYSVKNQSTFIYASSGAIYGDGTWGYSDDDATTFQLKPAHPYAQIRLEIDQWSLSQKEAPPFWAGLRISNVFGPNEYHKMANASIIYKAYNEILSYNNMRLFASDKKEYEDGGMKRDFIYVKDVLKVIDYFLEHPNNSGIYNVGSGKAESYKSIVDQVFKELGISPKYEFEPIPEVLKENFPYEVELPINQLIAAGYDQGFTPLEIAIKEYLVKYLMKGEFY
ncbi:MAG TPA: NAD-dependent epimerase/dehydratase family protein [Chitinophagales bacterium]|nr:NAD-dependent epimerase/dehydratase family protein [Chitinophagales bacterium]